MLSLKQHTHTRTRINIKWMLGSILPLCSKVTLKYGLEKLYRDTWQHWVGTKNKPMRSYTHQPLANGPTVAVPPQYHQLHHNPLCRRKHFLCTATTSLSLLPQQRDSSFGWHLAFSQQLIFSQQQAANRQISVSSQNSLQNYWPITWWTFQENGHLCWCKHRKKTKKPLDIVTHDSKQLHHVRQQDCMFSDLFIYIMLFKFILFEGVLWWTLRYCFHYIITF